MSYINRCDITGLTGSQLIGFARNQRKKRWPVAYPVYIYTLELHYRGRHLDYFSLCGGVWGGGVEGFLP